VVANTWFALFGPARLPTPIVMRLRAALEQMLEAPALRDELERISATPAEPSRRSPEYLAAFMRREIEKWRGAIGAAGAAVR